MAKAIHDYRCVIMWKETGEEDIAYIRLDPNISVINPPTEEEGILCTVPTWNAIHDLGRDGHPEAFIVKRVTL